MPAALILVFLLIEVLFANWFLSYFKGIALLGEIIISGLIGSLILTSMGQHFNQAINLVRKGELHPQDLFSSTLGRFIGGVLLFIPGLFTDLIGVFFLLKQTKNTNQSKTHFSGFSTQDSDSKEDDSIIDVEIVEEENNEKINHSN